MSQWQILVLGVLRLGLNADYDRIQELANNHFTLRQTLGHSDFADDKSWGVQTLKDYSGPQESDSSLSSHPNQ
jgi:hypothetical protein